MPDLAASPAPATAPRADRSADRSADLRVDLRVDLLTREYPPHVYGGAGVHVAELAAVLAPHADVRVRCFDGPRDAATEGAGVTGYETPAALASANPALATLGTDLVMADDVAGADLVHSHTWYANMAGHLGGLLHGVPHVVTAHSLEPLRPWKAEQLGGGYALSSWAERTAYLGAAGVIAVSAGMRADILRVYPELDPDRVHVVHNGIDLTGWRRPTPDDADAQATVRRHGIDPDRPAVVFVGRITRQKGLPYLLRAAAQLPPEVQLVLCAGAPDTPEIMAEVRGLVEDLRATRTGVVWIEEMLPRPDLTAVLAACTVFVCPSVYEPLGIVNLEAMAVGLPVVGTATGGIPEVVDDGVTGVLVPIEQADDGTGTPLDPDRFVADLAAALARVATDPAGAAAMGAAGRRRAEEHFAWTAIAERTMEVYRQVLAG
ncbi:glycogen synthase [Promicromonospora citrea]|uniref:D-inositol 3-phosphate glycosyltransferase n=1 Tax=Promicromonospora citrea TaxID=43677 RepID=A0A8H9GL41_9MICO|nr:glycogen synthase [Promicromonospora citrea]NNH54212.1 glycogen synthase [Promicromonospora citrea]GGM34553.1 glycogen synthase [Promicromonospora citrea]